MSIILVLSFLSLFRSVAGLQAAELPTSTTGTQLLPRQLFGGCGLNLNIWGQVSPIQTSGYANLCLQCRVNILGFSLGFSFYDALASSINAHGVSASDIAVLQGSVNDDIFKLSAGAKTGPACAAACSSDTRCASSYFTNGVCRLTPVNYANQNRAGAPLAQVFQRIFSQGGSRYCSLCPNDRTCGPSATGLPRRSLDSKKEKPKCPSGLTACPLSPTSDFTASTPFECLDTTEELSSCGGCTTLGRGKNCLSLKGVASSGCSDGKCEIFSCKNGYKYSKFSNTCYKRQHGKHPKV